MKKGFTLIELLSVIIILAIILVVAVPRIMKAIDSSKVNAYVSNEKLVLKSAELYVSKNIEYLPVNVGDTTEVLLSDLVSNGYVKDIKSPFNKNNSCSGYVLITKTDSDAYDYTPHINCIDSAISNSTQDGLVLHYKFDDFQEYRENLANTEVKRTLGFHNKGGYLHDGLGSSLAPEKGIGWYKFHISRRGTNYRIAQFPYIIQPISSTRTYSVEFDFGNTTGYYWTIDGVTAGAGVSVNSNKFAVTRVNASSQTGDLAIFLNNLGINQNVDDVIYYRYYQVENRETYTPFMDTLDLGNVKNHTPTVNLTTLQSASTPKWTNQSKTGSGAYYFNGTSSYIDINQMNAFANITMSAWIKPTVVGKWNGIIGGQDDARFVHFQINMNDNIDVYLYGVGKGVLTTEKVLINTWTHVALTYDGTIIKVYINGVLCSNTTDATGIINSTNIKPIRIGITHVTRYFTGNIDDVRVYSRALPEDEVRILYDSTK